jgi:hypothetical protein
MCFFGVRRPALPAAAGALPDIVTSHSIASGTFCLFVVVAKEVTSWNPAASE